MGNVADLTQYRMDREDAAAEQAEALAAERLTKLRTGCRRPIIPWIVSVQADVIRMLGVPGDPATTCWACHTTGNRDDWAPLRAHIVGRRVGGSEDPENFLLLCAWCHDEQHDCGSRNLVLAWARTHETYTERAVRLARGLAELGLEADP